jgi:hypothetical protein
LLFEAMLLAGCEDADRVALTLALLGAGQELELADLLAHERGAEEGVVLAAAEHVPGDHDQLARDRVAPLTAFGLASTTRATCGSLIRPIASAFPVTAPVPEQAPAVATELSLAADDRLTTEGERGREFFVLLDGAAAVRRKGRRIGTLGTGDVVGEIALVADVPRTATVTTEAPTRVLVIADYDFRRLLLESPSMTFKITQALAERLAMDAGMKRRPIV